MTDAGRKALSERARDIDPVRMCWAPTPAGGWCGGQVMWADAAGTARCMSQVRRVRARIGRRAECTRRRDGCAGMSNIEIACTFCSIGWVIGALAVLLIDGAPKGWPTYALVFLMFVGFGSCAAEDRVCEIAERGAP